MGNALRRLCPRGQQVGEAAASANKEESAAPAPSNNNRCSSEEGAGGGGGEIHEVAKPKLDPADFVFSGRKGEALVREPGQIQGQQFIVEECDDCDIFLLDHSAQVTVDYATNCRIFVGPCESSVFLRDCKGCSVVVACQQLRLRDCHGMDMLVHVSAGQPSIETSSGVRLGCFQYSYFSLREQLRAAGLSAWNTQWSNVHDFNHGDGTGQHWSFLPHGTGPRELGFRPASEVSSTVSAAEEAAPSVVPATWGGRPLPAGGGRRGHALAVILTPDLDAGFRLLDALAADLGSGDLVLVRTREASLTSAQVAALLGGVAVPPGAAGAPLVGLDFDGDAAALARVAAAAAATDGVAAATRLVAAGDESARSAERLFGEFAHVV